MNLPICSMVRKRAHIVADIAISSSSTSSTPAPGQIAGAGGPEEYDVMTSSTVSVLSEAESDLDTSGGSGRSIVTSALPTTSNAGGSCQANLYRSNSQSNQGHHHRNYLDESPAWYSHILTIDDLVEMDPTRGQFLASLQDLVAKKQAILAAHELSTEV